MPPPTPDDVKKLIETRERELENMNSELKRKAREFLDKNYKKLKSGDSFHIIYIIEPNSINGMAKIEHEPPKSNELVYGVRKNYITLNNIPNEDNYTYMPVKGLEGWYRSFSAIGNSASSKRFGGRRRTKRTKRRKSKN